MNYFKKIFVISSILFISFSHSAEENSQEKINEILRRFEVSHISETDPDGNPILHLLIENNYSFDIIKLFVENGADVHALDKDGISIVYKTILLERHSNILEFFIKNGADIHAKNRAGYTPLHKAVVFNRPMHVKILLKYGADSTIENNVGQTASDIAQENKLQSIIDLFKEDYTNIETVIKKTDSSKNETYEHDYTQILKDLNVKHVNEPDLEGNISLHRVHTFAEFKLLVENGADINAKNKAGYTPLITTVMLYDLHKDLRLAEFLIESGAKTNTRNNQDFSAFDVSILNNNQIMIDFLSDKTNIDAKDRFGNTLLHKIFTLKSNKPLAKQQFKLLINLRAKLDIKNKKGKTPLDVAQENGFDILEILNETDPDKNTILHTLLKNDAPFNEIELAIKLGADIHAINNDGQTPLDIAFKNRPLPELKFFVELEAKLNAKDNRENTTLHTLIKNNAPLDKIKLAIKATVKINAINRAGETFLDLALDKNLPFNILKLLAEKGAKTNSRDIFSNTALHRLVNIKAPLNKIKFVINTGADVNATNLYGNAVLHNMLMNKSPFAQIKLVITSGADVNAVNNIGKFPLDYAFENNLSLPIIELLVKNGAKTKVIYEHGNTILHKLVYTNASLDKFELAVKAGADLNAINMFEKTPLDRAFENDLPLPILEFLIKNEAQFENISLHNLVKNKISLDKLKLAVQSGADTHAKNSNGESLLDTALIHNLPLATLEFLVELGLKAKAKDREGNTSLHKLVNINAPLDKIELAINTGADLNAVNIYKKTPLYKAFEKDLPLPTLEFLVESGAKIGGSKLHRNKLLRKLVNANVSLDKIELAIKAGADIHTKNSNGKSLLDNAFEKNLPLTTLEFLVENGAKLTKTALYKLVKNKTSLDKIKLAVKAGANVHARNRYGKTSLNIAFEEDLPFDVLEFLVELGIKTTNAKDRFGNPILHQLLKNNASLDKFELAIKAGTDPHAKNNKEETLSDLARKIGRHDVVSFLEANSQNTLASQTSKNTFENKKNSSQKDSESENAQPCANVMVK